MDQKFPFDSEGLDTSAPTASMPSATAAVRSSARAKRNILLLRQLKVARVVNAMSLHPLPTLPRCAGEGASRQRLCSTVITELP